MATTTPIQVRAGEAKPTKVTLPAEANTLYMEGTLVARNASGRAANVSAGLPIMGVPRQTYDNRTAAESGGAAGAFDVDLYCGVFFFKYTGTAPIAGDKLYAVDNETVTITASTNGFAGVCVAPPQSINGVNYVGVSIGPDVAGLLG